MKTTKLIFFGAVVTALTLLKFNVVTAQDIDFKKENFPQQQKDLKKALKNLKKGDDCFGYDLKGKYAHALDYYLLANNFNPNNALLNYKIGVCYLNSYYKNTAYIYLDNAYRLDSNIRGDLPYYMGMAYQYNYDFDKAIVAYEKFRVWLIAENIKYDSVELNRKVRECLNGKAYVEKPSSMVIENIGENVNSLYDDYCPVINGDETILAYTSRRKGTGGKLNKYDYLYFEDIYFSYKRNGKWGIPDNPGKPLNGKTNDATVDLSDDGKTLTVYKNTNGTEFMYESQNKGGFWSKPERLDNEINARRYHQPSATYSKDRRTIYFISDKKGGIGGSDIYVSRLTSEGEWGPAFSIGNILNTPYDEDAVFLFNDTILYFSSQGHNSMGGFDIFLSRQVNGQWTQPVNLGYPVNSTADDLFLILAKGGDGYMSSDRQGGFGGHDLYYVKFTMTTEELLSQINPITIFGTVLDNATSEAVMATITVKDIKVDTLTAEIATNEQGKFDLYLRSAREHLVSVYIQGCDMTSVPRKMTFGTIYSQEFNPSKLMDTAGKATFITGHVADEKTGKGLQPDIEVVDIKTGKTVAMIVPDTSGNFSLVVASSMEYRMLIRTENCLHKATDIVTVNYTRTNLDGQIIALENIYFDFDRHYIRPDAVEVLDRHAELFSRHPDWKIKVEGHTDNMGSENYNDFLSKRRALAAIDYLVSKGVKKSRIHYDGYGYNKPATTNENDQGRQLNRRVEFRVYK